MEMPFPVAAHISMGSKVIAKRLYKINRHLIGPVIIIILERGLDAGERHARQNGDPPPFSEGSLQACRYQRKSPIKSAVSLMNSSACSILPSRALLMMHPSFQTAAETG